MADVIIPTWAEINGWVVVLIGAIGLFVRLWVKVKREEESTVTWIRDWAENKEGW